MTITKITTRGYSGPGTQFQYMPPGELTVADETSVGALTVTQELADYLVGIGIGEVVEGERTEGVDNPGSFVFKPDYVVDLDFSTPDLTMAPPLFTRDFNAPDGGTWYDLTDATRNELLEMIDRTEIEMPAGYQTKADLIALITATNE